MVEINLDHDEMVDVLNKCADGTCNDVCPYNKVPHDCSAQLLRDAAAMIKNLQSKTTSWISVEERLPDKELEEYHEKYGLFPFRVLVVIEGAVLSTSLIYDGEDFLDEDGEPYRVVKWMPMPEI